MSQKKSTQQETLKKGSTRSKAGKTARAKPGKSNPSIVRDETRTKGKTVPSTCFEDGVGEDVQAKIAERAHELYEQRGRFHGHDWEDWLKAEREILGEKGRF